MDESDERNRIDIASTRILPMPAFDGCAFIGGSGPRLHATGNAWVHSSRTPSSGSIDGQKWKLSIALPRLKSIASVMILDTQLCRSDVDVSQANSLQLLYARYLQTFTLGSLSVRGNGRSVVDEEAALRIAVLHVSTVSNVPARDALH
jgi:hypothetical protein